MDSLSWTTCLGHEGHAWEPCASWSGRYRCGNCGSFGHHAILTARSKYKPKTKGIIPYRCHKCFGNAIGKYRSKQFGLAPERWCCLEHIPKWVRESKAKQSKAKENSPK